VKALIFGPGRIGCGFAGQVLRKAGYEITFAGRGAIVDNLRRAGAYRVRLTDGNHSRDEQYDANCVRAIDTSDAASVRAAAAAADLIAVSVCPDNLEAIAPALADALAHRQSPIDVIAFENCTDPGGVLRDAVLRHSSGVAKAGHGFSSALVSRIVTGRQGDPSKNAPLVFLGDRASTFVVDGTRLRNPLPPIEGMRVVHNFRAWAMKKLYTFGAGHAATAYLGALKGYRYVHSAIRDPEIRAAVLAAMEEGRQGLLRRYGLELAGTHAELHEILARFDNAALNDPVTRVGRDPLRKLGPEDRLVGAARLAQEAGVSPSRLAMAAGAALCFVCALDRGACPAPAATVRTVAELDPIQGLGRAVLDAFSRLVQGREDDNVLLSLEGHIWSWSRREAAELGAA